MTVDTVMVGGWRIVVVGPPPSTPEPLHVGGYRRRWSGSLRTLMDGVPIPREDARFVRLALDEVESQARSLLTDCVLQVTGLKVILAEIKEARGRLG